VIAAFNHVEILVALIGGVALVITGVVTGVFQLLVMNKRLHTGNDHSIGEGVSSIEKKLDEHIKDTEPLVIRAKMEWGPDGTKEE
jgi:hypothetical protein